MADRGLNVEMVILCSLEMWPMHSLFVLFHLIVIVHPECSLVQVRLVRMCPKCLCLLFLMKNSVPLTACVIFQTINLHFNKFHF